VLAREARSRPGLRRESGGAAETSAALVPVRALTASPTLLPKVKPVDSGRGRLDGRYCPSVRPQPSPVNWETVEVFGEVRGKVSCQDTSGAAP
jgi:hypothetical protein